MALVEEKKMRGIFQQDSLEPFGIKRYYVAEAYRRHLAAQMLASANANN